MQSEKLNSLLQERITEKIKDVSVERKKIIAEIELQEMIDDFIIDQAEVRWARDAKLRRSGLEIIWTKGQGSSKNKFKVEAC